VKRHGLARTVDEPDAHAPVTLSKGTGA
jgi:hypothetical protein